LNPPSELVVSARHQTKAPTFPLRVGQLPWLGGIDLYSLAYPFVGFFRVLAKKDWILGGEHVLVA
jgi:hypothetical protein